MGGLDAAVAEEFLDGDQVGIGIEHLGGHGVPQLVTGDFQTKRTGVGFQAFLYAAHRYGLSLVAAPLYQKHLLGTAGRPNPEVTYQRLVGVRADVDDPVLAALAVAYVEPMTLPVEVGQRQPNHLGHPESGAEHQHKNGPVPGAGDSCQKRLDLPVAKMPGKRFCHPQVTAFADRVFYCQVLLEAKKIIKSPDAVEMAVDCLRAPLLAQEVVDVSADFVVIHLLQRPIHPDDEQLEVVQVAADRVGRQVPTLQMAAEADNRMG